MSIDTSVAHVARVYDYWLGGKDNFAADRLAGEQAIQAYPDIVYSVRANRAFLARTVRYLAAEAGIRQFLDVGTGIPTANNTHEVAQSAVPGSNVVYVDNHPVVLTEAALTLDFSRPVAIMLMAILQHIDDAEDPYTIVSTLLGAVPPGSYLTISHPAADLAAQQMAQMAERLNKLMAEKVTFRTRAQVAPFFQGLEMVEPGLVRVQEWRPDTEIEAKSPAALWGGMGRKA